MNLRTVANRSIFLRDRYNPNCTWLVGVFELWFGHVRGDYLSHSCGDHVERALALGGEWGKHQACRREDHQALSLRNLKILFSSRMGLLQRSVDTGEKLWSSFRMTI